MKNALLVLGVAALVLVACSSDSGPAPFNATSGGPPGTSSSSTTSSSGGGTTSGTPGASSGNPTENVSCEVAGARQTCTMPADVYGAEDVALTTDASCKTSIYAVGSPTNGFSDVVVRRYSMTSITPCVFERDMAFPETTGAAVVAADDAGNVLTIATDGTHPVLIQGGTSTACTGTALDPASGPDTSSAVMARDGSVAYLGHVDFENGSVKSATITKVTISGGTCEHAAFPLTGDALSGIRGIAIDTKGRLHVVDATLGGGTKRVVIYGPDGTFVSSYNSDGKNGFFAPSSVTACKGGICVDGFENVVSYDENGVPRNAVNLQTAVGLSGLIRYMSTPRGPFFLVGDSYDDPKRLVVQTMLQP